MSKSCVNYFKPVIQYKLPQETYYYNFSAAQ